MYESNYITFWKRQNYGDSRKFSDCQRLAGGRNEKKNFRARKLFSMIL